MRQEGAGAHLAGIQTFLLNAGSSTKFRVVDNDVVCVVHEWRRFKSVKALESVCFICSLKSVLIGGGNATLATTRKQRTVIAFIVLTQLKISSCSCALF